MDNRMPKVAKIHHYSIENPATIYDEESLTVLKLVGRVTVKINELIESYTKFAHDLLKADDEFKQDIVLNFIKEVESKMEEQDGKINDLFNLLASDLLTVAREVMDELIANGQLSEVILDSFEMLNARVQRKPWEFTTVTDMKACELLSAGDLVYTQGYHASRDGGAGVYTIRAKAEGDIDNGGSIHIIGDLVAELMPDNKVSVKQFGAKGDGVTDDTQAFINAGDYARVNKIDLVSDNASYLTTEACIIQTKMNNVYLPGVYPFLEIRGSSSLGGYQEIKVNECTHVILRGFKNSKFIMGNIKTLDIIADPDVSSTGSFAYCDFEGGYIENLNISGVGSGWVNENTFNQIRMKQVSIDGDYPHNNNRFHNVTLEGGVINLGNCNGNYFSIRGESGCEVTTTDSSVNNIIERTWSSYEGAYKSSYPHFAGNSNVYTSEIYGKLQPFTIKEFNIRNMVWNDGADFATGRTLMKAWQEYGDPIIVPLQSSMVFHISGNNIRCSIQLLDETYTPVRCDDPVFMSSHLKYNASSERYTAGNNLDMAIASIHMKADCPAKYARLNIQQGNAQATDTLGAKIVCWTINEPEVHHIGHLVPTAEKIPTQTEGVPVGFEVMSSVNGTIWYFNGTEWVER